MKTQIIRPTETPVARSQASSTGQSVAKALASAILAITVLALPQTASAFDSTNGMEVNEVNANVFEVIPRRGGASGDSYWCAAGEYAEEKLRAKPREVVYVVRGPGASETTDRVEAVQFTLNPSAVGVTPGPLAEDANDFNVGGHMGLGLARTNCNM